MIVDELERRFFELKGKLDVGVLNDEQFKAEIEKLRFQDKQQRWWMIGAQSGKWYCYDGMRWLPGTPPNEAPMPEPTTSPLESEPSTPIVAPAANDAAPAPPAPQPRAIPTNPQSTAPSHPASAFSLSAALAHVGQKDKSADAPASSAPAQPAPQLRPRMSAPLPRARTRTPLRLPIAGPILIALAALIALFGVIVMWLVVDNVLPNKPISSFFGLNASAKTPVVTITTPTPAGAPSPQLLAVIAKGDELLVQSQVESAIAQYQSAAQAFPASALPLVRLARVAGFKGQMQAAVTQAQSAVQRAPTDADAYAQLCRALTWSGQVNDAIAAGEQAIKLDAKNANAHAFLAEAYLLARRSEASAQAQTALQLAPNSAEAHRAQAWVLTLQAQKDLALAEWRQTTALEPNFYFRHYELAQVLQIYFSAPAEATVEYQQAVALYGAYVPAISRLGQTLLATNNAPDAIAQFRRAITLDPNNAENTTYLGIAYGRANDCAQAIPYFNLALTLDANNLIAQKARGECQTGKPPTVPVLIVPLVPLPPQTLVPSK